MMIPHLLSLLIAPTRNLRLHLLPHRRLPLLLLLLALAILFEDGHQSTIRNSSASSRMPRVGTLGKPLANDFIVILTAAKLVGIG